MVQYLGQNHKREYFGFEITVMMSTGCGLQKSCIYLEVLKRAITYRQSFVEI